MFYWKPYVQLMSATTSTQLSSPALATVGAPLPATVSSPALAHVPGPPRRWYRQGQGHRYRGLHRAWFRNRHHKRWQRLQESGTGTNTATGTDIGSDKLGMDNALHPFPEIAYFRNFRKIRKIRKGDFPQNLKNDDFRKFII